MLKLYNKEHEAISVLTNLKDYKIEYVLSGEDLLEFSLSICDENIHLVEEEGYVRNKNNEYVIKAIDPSDNFKRFTCNVNIEDIVGKAIANFDTSNNKLDDTIRLAIAGTGWILVDSGITKRRTVRLTNTNALEVLREIRKVFRVDFRFDAINKIIHVYEQFGEDKGVYFSDELNLKSFSIPSDTYDYATRLYCYGKDGLNISSINNGKEYIENFQYSNKVIELIWEDNRYTDVNSLKEDAEAKLEELSKPKRTYQAEISDLAKQSKEYSFLDFFLGDTIILLSKQERFRDKQRIVKYIEYPNAPSQNSCELGNTTLTFEELQAENEAKNQVVDNVTTGNGIVNGKSIDGISTEQIYDFEASVGKIVDFTAINADITNLKAENVTITGKLSAIEGEFGTLKTNVGVIDQLTVTHSALINDLQANKADITDLTATNIKFNVASGGTLDLQTLLSKFVTGENGQFINISSSNSVIANATIKNAMIESLSVDKLLAGRISTNKFTVSSDDGGIEIVGATQQFKDKNNKVRIQMGQDTQGNFNFILRGEDGTTTLIDHTGIKDKAIADKLIKSNMVADGAIGEQQINYSSLVTGLNKDTNTQLIKASKVAIDLTGQSLEVAFNSLKSNVDNMEIGGRNLLVTSNMKHSPKLVNASASISGLKVELYPDNNSFKLTSTTTSSENYYRFMNPSHNNLYGLEAGEYYTISGYIRGNQSTGTFKYRSESSNGSSWGYSGHSEELNIESEDTFKFFKFSTKIPTGAKGHYVSFKFYNPVVGGWIEVKDIKFEKGNKATDCTPAPEDIDQKIESNTTAITVAQGKIEGLISENTIIKGDVTTISDKYTSLKATVDGINTTVASHTSSIGTINTNISNLSGKVTTVENNYTSISQDLSGFKTTVGNTYSTKSELSNLNGTVSSINSRVSTAESLITQLNNQIALKVEATDIINAINSAKSYTDAQITTVDKNITDKVAEIKLTTDSIIQRVSSTESTADSALEKATTAQQTAENIKTEVNQNLENNYATKSLVTQTANDVRYEFQQYGSHPNLMINGCPKYNNYKHSGWYTQDSWVDSSTDTFRFATYTDGGYNEGFLYSPTINVTPNTTYSLSYWLEIEDNVHSHDCFIWEIDKNGTWLYTQHIVTSTDHWWRKYTKTFTIGPNTHKIVVRFDHNGYSLNNGSKIWCYLDYVMLCKGSEIYPINWYPCAEEVIGDTTIINGNGIVVTHTNGSYTQVGSRGLEHWENGLSKPYHYMFDCIIVDCNGKCNGTWFTVQLPSIWKGKDFTVAWQAGNYSAPYSRVISGVEVNCRNKNITNATVEVCMAVYTKGEWAGSSLADINAYGWCKLFLIY